MPNKAEATSSVLSHGQSWATVGGHHLDSPELAAEFLAAAGLAGTAWENKSTPRAAQRVPSHYQKYNQPIDGAGESGYIITNQNGCSNQSPTPQPEQQLPDGELEARSKYLQTLRITQRLADSSSHPDSRQKETVNANAWRPAETRESEVGWKPDLAEDQAEDRNKGLSVGRSVDLASRPAATTFQASREYPSHSHALNPNMVRPKMAMAPVPKPSKLDRYAPDLVARKTPRPDRYYRGSPPRSPPSSVITFHGSDAGTQNPALSNTVAKPEKDIRNAIALEHKFFMSDGKWHNWHQDDDAALARPNYFVPFVSMWSKGHPRFPEASSFHDHWGRHDHWNCDIDTDTGVFLPPVDYPYTMANESKLDPELDWRRQNWTSALMMRRRMDLRRNLRSNSRPQSQTHQEEDSRPELQQDPMLVHPSWFVTVDTPKLEQPEYMHYVPRIPCFLRPAKKSDMEGVHLIYNQEMQFGFQTLDFHFLSAEDFEKILNTTEELGFPFIVAVRGSARDLRLKGGNILHSPYRQITRDDSDRHGQKSGEILGFAFLSVWELGLTGSGTGSSRATAKLHVFVHHEHRRKKIGFSLMDMVLTTVSDRFSSHSGYDFIDADDNPIYKSPKSHERKYFRIYVNYLVKHKHIAEGNKKLEEEQKGYDDDLVWVRKMLEDGLNFTEKVRFEAVHRTPKCREGPAFWLDSVVFEHTCQFDPRSLGEF